MGILLFPFYWLRNQGKKKLNYLPSNTEKDVKESHNFLKGLMVEPDK